MPTEPNGVEQDTRRASPLPEQVALPDVIKVDKDAR